VAIDYNFDTNLVFFTWPKIDREIWVNMFSQNSKSSRNLQEMR